MKSIDFKNPGRRAGNRKGGVTREWPQKIFPNPYLTD